MIVDSRFCFDSKDNRGNLEELTEEIEALTDTLKQQSHYLSSFSQTSHNGGQWYYIPPNQNVSYDSLMNCYAFKLTQLGGTSAFKVLN